MFIYCVCVYAVMNIYAMIVGLAESRSNVGSNDCGFGGKHVKCWRYFNLARACMYVCIHACMCVCMMNICTCTYIYGGTYTCIHIHI
jgi:hypothetical protein